MLTAAQRQARQKAAQELIRLGFENDPNSFKKMPRNRLTKVNADKVFEVDIDYLQDDTGTVIYPDDWMWHCLPAPFTYFIVEKQKLEYIPDAKEDPAYAGDAQVVVTFVPLECKPQDIVAWVRKGLESEDMSLQRAIQAVEKTKVALSKTEEKLKNVPFMETKAEKASDAAAERRMVTKYLEHEKKELESQLEMREETLVGEYKRKSREVIKAELIRRDEEYKEATFYLYFPDKSVGNKLEFQAANKESWVDVRLAIGDGRKRKPMASFEEIPPDMKRFEVNMRRVRVARYRHGKGVLIYPDSSAYSGQWVENKKHGNGKFYTSAGKYSGVFENEHLRGYGKYEYASGEVHEGKRDTGAKYESPRLLTNVYETGVLHDYHCKLVFPDGSTYEGQMTQGKITGEGTWKDPATGALKRGVFKEGKLHGRGKMVTAKGEVYEGEFYNGLPHHECRFTDKNGDIFFGEYIHGDRDGRGKYVYKNGDVYDGYYHADLRHGHGSLTYGNVSHTWDPKFSKTFLEYSKRYEGDWSVGKIRARGMRSAVIKSDTLESDTSHYYTTNNRSRRYPHLFSLQELEAKRSKRKRRMYRKLRVEALKKTKENVEKRLLVHREGRTRALGLFKEIQARLDLEREKEQDLEKEIARREQQMARARELQKQMQIKRQDSVSGVTKADKRAQKAMERLENLKKNAAAITKISYLSKVKVTIADLFEFPPRKKAPRGSGRISSSGTSGKSSELDNFVRNWDKQRKLRSSTLSL